MLKKHSKSSKKRLVLYPVRIAAVLAITSIILYIFFSIWPLTYSIYIAFTDANATNIASDPKIAELKSIYDSSKNYLLNNKDKIISYAKEVDNNINSTILQLNMFKEYLQNVTPQTFSTDIINNYRNNINGYLLRIIQIVNSNETYFYYYTELRNTLSKAYTITNSMWNDVDNIIGFKLFYTQEDINKIKDSSLPKIGMIVNELTNSSMILKTIEENYDSFIETVLSDVSNEINRLSMHFVGLQNFVTLFTDSRFPYSILKTILFVLTSVPLKVIFGIIIAFLFSSPMIYGRKIMRAMLLIPWALPVLLSVTTWRMLFAPDGPLALILGQMLNYKFSIYTHEWDAFFVYNIVEMWLAYPFIMTITMGAIASVPKEFIEASYIDGISVFSRFRKIMLPLTIKPILFATILTSGASLQAFMVPLLINDGGPTTMIKLPGFTSTLGNANELMILYGYNRAWLDQQYGLSTATFLVVVAILFIYALIWFYFIYKRGSTK